MEPNSETKLRIAGIVKESVCDGPGIRFTIFVQGCPHRCEGCHNAHTHDPEGGYEITIGEILNGIESLELLDGITFSGGEPFSQAAALSELARSCRDRGLSILTYTGYVYENILDRLETPGWSELLAQTDILIDGPYLHEKATHEIPFLGSHNQRILDLNRIRET